MLGKPQKFIQANAINISQATSRQSCDVNNPEIDILAAPVGLLRADIGLPENKDVERATWLARTILGGGMQVVQGTAGVQWPAHPGVLVACAGANCAKASARCAINQ